MKLNGNAVKPGNVIEHNGRLMDSGKSVTCETGQGRGFCPD